MANPTILTGKVQLIVSRGYEFVSVFKPGDIGSVLVRTWIKNPPLVDLTDNSSTVIMHGGKPKGLWFCQKYNPYTGAMQYFKASREY